MNIQWIAMAIFAILATGCAERSYVMNQEPSQELTVLGPSDHEERHIPLPEVVLFIATSKEVADTWRAQWIKLAPPGMLVTVDDGIIMVERGSSDLAKDLVRAGLGTPNPSRITTTARYQSLQEALEEAKKSKAGFWSTSQEKASASPKAATP